MPYETTSHHILLVDDNNLDTTLFERALQKTNADIKLTTAKDGQQALKQIKQWETGATAPIVILLDLKLPKVNGLDVLHALKSHPRFKIIPVVVLTSSNEMSDIEQAYTLGANSYIMKAVDYDEFAGVVARLYHYWCQLNIYPE